MEYPKQVLTTQQIIRRLSESGMDVESQHDAEQALTSIGYYRLRGYCYHLYDNQTKCFSSPISFQSLMLLYRFDRELSHLVFRFSSEIEVSLRARLTDSLLLLGDPLVLSNPKFFVDKKKYWDNYQLLCREICRSNDVFIQHNFDHHDGMIPIWAAVEVMSFGTLSKTIKNLFPTGNAVFPALVQYYTYINSHGISTAPSKNMFTSWIQSVVSIRNLCAHGSRIYNRSLTSAPQLLNVDQPSSKSKYTGLYEILLAMKYLRPSDEVWREFTVELLKTFEKYDTHFEYARLNFPENWRDHLIL